MPENNRRKEAVVLSAGGSPAAYDIVRSLGIAGIGSHVASAQPDEIAFHSSYCARRLVVPGFNAGREEELLRLMLDFGKSVGEGSVLYYASDAELTFVWRFRRQLQEVYRFLLPSDATMEALCNKVRFAEFARLHNLPAPATRIVADKSELLVMLPLVKFPCIVKPAFSQDWVWETEEQQARFGPYKKALRRFESPGALADFCAALPERASGFLIQSYIEGRDEAIVSFHGYFDEQSRCLGYFIGRKIRTYPPHTGGSVYIETLHQQALADRSIDYLRRIAFQGIVKIDFKWDPDDAEFKILEINPRYNLWELLGAYAGANLSCIAYRHQNGLSNTPQVSYRAGTRLLYVKQDLRAFFGGYRKTKEWTLRAYLRSLMTKKQYGVFDPRDPVPFLVSALGFLKRKLLRRNAMRILPRDAGSPAPVREDRLKSPPLKRAEQAVLEDNQ